MNEKLLSIFTSTLGIAASEVVDEMSTANTAAWDSVAHLNLVLSIEQEFGLQFSPEDFMRMQSLGAIKGVLAERGVA